MPKSLLAMQSPCYDFARGLTPMSHSIDLSLGGFNSLANSPSSLLLDHEHLTLGSMPDTKSPEFPFYLLKFGSGLVSPNIKAPTLPQVDDLDRPINTKPASRQRLFDDDPPNNKRAGDVITDGPPSKKNNLPSTPQRVKNPVIDPSGGPQSIKTSVNPCNCKKSKCLKLYCDCFAAQIYCNGCNCNECRNLEMFESERLEAVKATIARNPSAFLSKIETPTKSPSASTPGQHHKGCHCKKSGCLKKYCECYHLQIFCGAHCKCNDCKNFSGSVELIARRRQQAQAASPTINNSPTTPESTTDSQYSSLSFVSKPSKLSAVIPVESFNAPTTAEKGNLIEEQISDPLAKNEMTPKIINGPILRTEEVSPKSSSVNKMPLPAQSTPGECSPVKNDKLVQNKAFLVAN